MSQQAKAKEPGISRRGILEIILKFLGIGSIPDQPRCGHPSKLLQRIVRKLNRITKVQLKKTVRQVMDECNLSIFMSVDIIKSILWEQELKGYVAA